MKKITLGFLVVLAAMAFVVGCSNFGASGNPTELTGTWTGSTTEFGLPTSYVQDILPPYTNYEGTWEDTDVTLPVPSTIYTDEAGITWTIYGTTQAAVRTTTTTDTLVIAADSSWVKTTVESVVETARAAIPAVLTGTSRTLGSPALVAGSYTDTTVTTVTPTINIDKTWTVTTTTSESCIATGAYVGQADPLTGLTLSAVTQTQTTTSTAVNAANSGYAAAAGGLTQTAFGADYGYAYARQTDTAYSLVIAENGGYTLTTTETVTDVAPGAGGTAVTTMVETGTVLGAVGSGFNAGATLVTFNQTGIAVTFVGTGTLISASFPATALTVTQAVAEEKIYEYLITKGTSNTYLQVFSPNIVSAGYDNPWTTLVKSGT